MRKLNMKRIKRAGTLALATVMLAGALALPASAAADPAYMEDLQKMLAGDLSAQALVEKYPNSPEANYYYAADSWAAWRNETKAYEPGRVPELLSYLDRAIALGVETDHPYQAKWDGGGEDGQYPSSTGYEVDYTMQAAGIKADLEMWTLGHQAQAANAEQQYLDCWDRWDRIEMKYLEQDLQQRRQNYIAWGATKEEADEEVASDRSWYTEAHERVLNETIPNLRAELESIRAWDAANGTTENTTFDVGLNTSSDGNYLHVEKGNQYVILTGETSAGARSVIGVVTDLPIQAIQRTLNSLTIFVMEGTEVTLKAKNSYIAMDSHTADQNPCAVAQTLIGYNGDYFRVYVVGV